MELQLEGGKINAKRPQDLCTEAFWVALIQPASPQEAARAIAYSQKLRDEAKAIGPDFMAMASPMTTERLREKLLALSSRCGSPDAETLDRMLRPYMASLSMPEFAFDEAIARWDAGEWFKKPGMDFSDIFPRADQIADMAAPFLAEAAKAVWRMRKALEAIDNLPKPKSARMTRQQMIDAGYLDQDGRAILDKCHAPAPQPVDPTPRPDFIEEVV